MLYISPLLGTLNKRLRMYCKKAACSVTLSWLLVLLSPALLARQKDPLSLARQVAGKVIRDTRFQLQPVLQQTVLGMQVIDFSGLPLRDQEVAYACTSIYVPEDTTVVFGINSTGALQIWLNRQHQFSQEPRGTGQPVETNYGRFLFNNSCTLQLHKGTNDLLFRYEAGSVAPVVYFRPILSNGDLQPIVQFLSPADAWRMQAGMQPDKSRNSRAATPAKLPVNDSTGSPWLLLGPFPESAIAVVPGKEFAHHYEIGGRQLLWQSPPQKTLSGLFIDPAITYRREAYADWHYANGITLWSMQALSAVSDDTTYQSHVKDYLRFLLRQKDYFEWQYQSQYAFRGSYHRLFRLTMPEDAGAPALAAAAQYGMEKTAPLNDLLTPITDYIINRQLRLTDGTFCSPGPVDSTVRADDLFMNVPYLLCMAKATGQSRYADEAAGQCLLFQQHLLDPATGLYRHGWSRQSRQQAARWGRANGWMAWAAAELLSWLPEDHPSYRSILEAFRAHAASLLKYQQSNGFWRQLPDRSDSYEETSCTAMFTLVFARGVRKGWLPASYRQPALNGWQAVASRIDADGTVHGICGDTEIGFDEQYYRTRPTVDNDPCGLGAVITAGIEISLLNRQP